MDGIVVVDSEYYTGVVEQTCLSGYTELANDQDQMPLLEARICIPDANAGFSSLVLASPSPITHSTSNH